MSYNCPVCSSDIPKPYYYDNKGTGMERYSCPRCGDFNMQTFLARGVTIELNNDNTKIAALSHWIRTRHDTLVKTPPDERGFRKSIILDEHLIQSIIKEKPPTPTEQADNFVRWVGDKMPSADEYIAVNKFSILGILGSKNEREFLFVVNYLKEKGTIKTKTAVGRGHVDAFDVTLSFNGLRYYDEIRESTKQADARIKSDRASVSEPEKAKSGHGRTGKKKKGKLSKERSMATSGAIWRLPSSKDIWDDINKEFEINKQAFGKRINFVKNAYKRTAIFRDLEHAYILANNGLSKPAVILAGSVIEELLRLYLKAKKVNASQDTFDAYIKACEKTGLLKGAVRLSDSVRHFRNLVHLARETSSTDRISKATAKSAVASVFVVANGFAGGGED
ncbi:MAG: hypothetical protein ACYSWO_05645 [Planctomycetota bacterium]